MSRYRFWILCFAFGLAVSAARSCSCRHVDDGDDSIYVRLPGCGCAK